MRGYAVDPSSCLLVCVQVPLMSVTMCACVWVCFVLSGAKFRRRSYRHESAAGEIVSLVTCS